MPEPRDAKQHILYRHFGGGGELLYVGITADPGTRLRAHARNSLWWGDVVGVTLEHFASRDDLRVAERAAIQVERPRYNKIHSPDFVKVGTRGVRLKDVVERPLPPADSTRVLIDGKSYVLPPGLYWDADQLGVRRR